VFSTPGAYAAQPEALLGYVFHSKNNASGDCGASAFSDLELGTEMLLNSPPTPQRQSKVIYQSTVDDHMKHDGAYAGLISGGVQADRKAEIVVTDHVSAVAQMDKFNASKLAKLQTEAGKRPNECMFLITGVTLSSISKRFFKKVGANGAVAGLGFKYDGEMYSQDGGFSEEMTIGVSLVRVRADGIGLNAGTEGPPLGRTITVPSDGFKAWKPSETP
jgi:hypothetical protein